MEKNIVTYSLVNEEHEDEYEVQFDLVMGDTVHDKLKKEIDEGLSNIDVRLEECYEKINCLNKDIDFYTSNADKLDIIIAACSGMLTAVLDAIWKEMRLKKILGGSTEGKDLLDFFNESGSKSVNEFVKNIGSNKGATSDSLNGTIRFLEERFNIPSDSLTSNFGGSRQHHLRDFAHHPSIVGLVFSLITQFTMNCYGTDKSGMFIVVPLEFIEGKKGRIAKSKSSITKEIKVIGENIGEKIVFATVIWFFHLVSDMAGSSNTPGAGMGIPGPLLSLAKELSVLPIFRRMDSKGNKTFSVWISKLYNGTLLAKRDSNGKIIEARKVDFRTEVGLFKELRDQAIPVLLNEFIVRGFYFVRRLFGEIKLKSIKKFNEFEKIDTDNILPFKNRTVIRMMTVSSGVFTATNLTVATIMGAKNSGGNLPGFVAQAVLRINFVGIGRFAVAIGAEVVGETKKNNYEKEKFEVQSRILELNCTKVLYLNADVLLQLESTDKKIEDVFDAHEEMWSCMSDVNQAIMNLGLQTDASLNYLKEAYKDIDDNLDKIIKQVDDLEKRKPGFKNELLKMLRI